MSGIFSSVRPTKIKKYDFLKTLTNIFQEGKEISWLTTDTISFGWEDINSDREAFFQKIKSMRLRSVTLATLSKDRKTEYIGFTII